MNWVRLQSAAVRRFSRLHSIRRAVRHSLVLVCINVCVTLYFAYHCVSFQPLHRCIWCAHSISQQHTHSLLAFIHNTHTHTHSHRQNKYSDCIELVERRHTVYSLSVMRLLYDVEHMDNIFKTMEECTSAHWIKERQLNVLCCCFANMCIRSNCQSIWAYCMCWCIGVFSVYVWKCVRESNMQYK